MSQSYMWAQYDALLEHEGKAPYDCIHHEDITDQDFLKDLSNKHEAERDPGLCRAFIFATGGPTRGVCLAAQSGSTCDHLAVKELFPNGALSIRLLEIPGTGLKLINDWRIIISNGKGRAPMNKAVKSCFNVEWEGNIVLACYHRAAPNWPRMNCVPLSLIPFIIFLLKKFLEVYKDAEGTAQDVISISEASAIVSGTF